MPRAPRQVIPRSFACYRYRKDFLADFPCAGLELFLIDMPHTEVWSGHSCSLHEAPQCLPGKYPRISPASASVCDASLLDSALTCAAAGMTLVLSTLNPHGYRLCATTLVEIHRPVTAVPRDVASEVGTCLPRGLRFGSRNENLPAHCLLFVAPHRACYHRTVHIHHDNHDDLCSEYLLEYSWIGLWLPKPLFRELSGKHLDQRPPMWTKPYVAFPSKLTWFS